MSEKIAKVPLVHPDANVNKFLMEFIALKVFIDLSIYLCLIIEVFLCEILDMTKNSNTSLLLQHVSINFWCPVLFAY